MLDSISDSTGPDIDLDGPGLCGFDYDIADCDTVLFDFVGDIDVTQAEVLGESGGDLDSADYGDGDGSIDGNPLGWRCKASLDSPVVVAVHVVGHGDIDFQPALKELAVDCELVRVPWIRSGERELRRHYDKLMPLSTWTASVGSDCMSDGHYPGASGSTDVLRQYFAAGVRNIPFLPIGGLTWDKNAKAFVEVTVITWHYHETGDHESRVLIRVRALPEYKVSEGRYFFNRSPIVCLNGKACALKKKVFQALRQAAPGWAARMTRKACKAGTAPVPARRDVVSDRPVVEEVELAYGMGTVTIPA